MAWPCKKIESWGDFLNLEKSKPPRKGGKPNYIFRGQADKNWRLDPSLVRLVNEINANLTTAEIEEIEIALLNDFVINGPSHFPDDVVSALKDPAARWS